MGYIFNEEEVGWLFLLVTFLKQNYVVVSLISGLVVTGILCNFVVLVPVG